jgi:hypothetical protein
MKDALSAHTDRSFALQSTCPRAEPSDVLQRIPGHKPKPVFSAVTAEHGCARHYAAPIRQRPEGSWTLCRAYRAVFGEMPSATLRRSPLKTACLRYFSRSRIAGSQQSVKNSRIERNEQSSAIAGGKWQRRNAVTLLTGDRRALSNSLSVFTMKDRTGRSVERQRAK